MAINGFRRPAHRTVTAFNAGVLALAGAPVVGRFVTRYIAVISYTGRKSGRVITLPVGFRREGDTVTIQAGMAARKVWWRNFLGAGAPLAIELDGARLHGHAVSRLDRRRAVVTVELDPD